MKEIIQKRNQRDLSVYFFWSVTIVLILISLTLLDSDLAGWKKALYIVIRSITVLVVWIFVVSPLLMRLLKSFLDKKKSKYKSEVDNALTLFPYLKTIIILSWKESINSRGIKRIREFVTNCILYSMFFKTE